MWRGSRVNSGWLDVERLVGLHHEVDPAGRDVHARQVARVVDDLVDLDDDDAVGEGRGFDQRRGVLGARAGVDVALAVGGEAGHQRDVGDQVHQQARIELDVGVDGTDFQQAVFQQLADAQALRTGEGEVELARDLPFEQVQMLGAADAGHDHVQVVQLAGIDLGQRAGEEIRLLLVVAFEYHAIAGCDQRFQGLDDPLAGQHHAIGEATRLIETPGLFGTTTRPLRRWGHCCCHDDSTGFRDVELTVGSAPWVINQAGGANVTQIVMIKRDRPPQADADLIASFRGVAQPPERNHGRTLTRTSR